MSLNTGNAILSNAITVDSSYKVGIGTSSPATLLQVSGSSTTYNTAFSILNTSNSVGIGTTAPSAKLHVYGTATVFNMLLENSNSNAYTVYQAKTANSSLWQFGVWNNDSYRIGISGVADYLTVTNSGYVGINNTNPQARLHIAGSGGSEISFAIYDGGSRRTFFIPSQYYGYMWACEIVSNGGKAWSFGSAGGGGEVGTIVVNASSTAYNTTSDYRLKEDLKDFNGLELLSKVKVYDFKWKKEDARTHGVMAHELQEILPYAVSGEKDAINHEGKIEAQSVDYSKIVPSLVKAIQELNQKVTDQQQQINQLINK